MVERYFQTLLDLIAAQPFIFSSDIALEQRGEFVAFIRGNIYFADDSRLHMRELTSLQFGAQRIAYAYHYQRADNTLVFRYDNTAHFPALPNAPHHKHDGDESNVVASAAPDLRAVLDEIAALITF